MLRFFTLLITSFLCFQINSRCVAQDVDKIIKKGIEELEEKNDIIAYNYFLDALYLDPENKKAKLYAGICHLHLQSPQKALEYLIAVKDSDESSQLIEFPAYLAMAYHLNLDFKHAEEIINNLKDTTLSGDVDIDLIKNNIKSAIAEYDKSYDYTVLNMGEGINTRQHEYGTAAFSDHRTFLYTSRPDLWDQDTIKNQRKLYENVFLVELDSINNWKEPDYFTNPHLRGNDAVIQVFDNDTKLLTYHNGDLLISSKKEDYWEKGMDLKGINTPANESHGFISEDGKTLYFSSNFDTDDGNLNLYISHKEGNSWSEPKELVGLNTPYDEDAPFIGEDGYFYFSSKGHNSIGNYDIFRTKYDEEQQAWQEPENLGVPINSVFDDLYYTTYGRLAYFSSLRPGGNGGMDLYRVLPFKEIEVFGKIIEKETGEVLENSSENLQFGSKNFTVTTDNEGKYNLTVPVSESNYFHVAKNDAKENVIIFHFGDSNSVQRHLDVPLDIFSSEVPKTKLDTSPNDVQEEEDRDEEKEIIAKEEKEAELNSDSSNTEVIANNMEIKTEEEEVIPKETTSDTKVAKQRSNSNISEETISQSSDKQENVQPSVEGISLNREKSFEDNKAVARIRSGRSANLYLYFDFGAAIINEVFYEELDQIAAFLQSDEGIVVEVGGHTDNIGSEVYNERLSERRAKAVALYLIERGVDKSRVIAKGYGESFPIASNDDEKEGRELNRRVEIKKLSNGDLSSISE